MRLVFVFVLAFFTLLGPRIAAAEECNFLSREFWGSATADDVLNCSNGDEIGFVNEQDNDGNTPLHHAVVVSRSTAAVRQLLTLGADHQTPNRIGWTPLHSLAAEGTVASHVAALAIAGADLDASARDDTCWRPLRNCVTTPLHLVSKRSNVPNLLRAFLAAGADVSQKDPEGRTALHHAAAMSNAEEVEALLAADGDVDAEDFNDWTPLHLAARRGPAPGMIEAAADLAIINVLLDSGADPDVKNSEDQTPLFLAASYTTDPGVWSRLLDATDQDYWCIEDDNGRTVQSAFDNQKNLPRDPSMNLVRDPAYWRLNNLCP